MIETIIARCFVGVGYYDDKIMPCQDARNTEIVRVHKEDCVEIHEKGQIAICYIQYLGNLTCLYRG